MVDKPSGITSHDVVSWARRCSGIKRIGHTGTLDPLASGLLILLIGRSFTRLQDTFLKQDKEYIVKADLGLITDSYDITGRVVSEARRQDIHEISKHKLHQILPAFTGSISQAVPSFSAVKVDGKKLYELARAQKIQAASLPVRKVDIYALELLDFNANQDARTNFTLKINCSSGTYVRSLVHDLGKVLSVGAVVTELRRTKIGKLDITDASVCPLFITKKH